MPSRTESAAVGVSSFMQGFSFIDQINQRNRAQKKLDARLEEERKDREFRRGRLEQIDIERGEDREFTAAERERVANERALGREGDRFALDPQASDDDLRRTAAFSANAFNALAKRIGQAEALQALKDVQGAGPPTQTGGLNSAVTGESPGEIAPPGTASESLLAPSRGRSATQSVDLDELSQFDPEAPQGGFFSRLRGRTAENIEGAGDRVSSSFRGLSVAAANVVNEAFDLPPAASGASFGRAIGGNIDVPEAFTTEEEFASITDPAEFERARQTNEAIIADIKDRGIAASNETDLSRLEALKAGDRVDRAEAQRQEFIVTQRYQNFNEPTEANKARELAAEDPQAASIQYANDRATLQSASPQLAADMDASMQPVFQAAEAASIEAVMANPQGSVQRAKAVNDLRGLRVTQEQVYKDYSPHRAAGINDQGMPIGNSQLSGQVLQAVEDPNRPRPAEPLSAREIMTAGTITNRMGNTRRASDVQLKAGIKLVDMGLASTQDLMTLNMTGSWPPTAPAAKLETYRPGDVVMTVDGNGNYKHAFTVPGGPNERGDIPVNQLTPATLEQFRVGVETRFPAGKDGNDELIRTLTNQVLVDADTLQETVDLTDPLAGQRLGQTYAAVLALASEEDSWLPNWMESAPSMQEILASPAMAAELAVEHGIPLSIPVLQARRAGIRINNLREELQIPGKFPPGLERAALEQDDETFLQTVARYDAIIKQNQAQ